ncbi:hypothetical protein [Bacillus toyonensis]|uniref:hypothetical protein n=1 Tax=Bacillus toyonensis TaxID=155322 RepID=UPI003D64D49C
MDKLLRIKRFNPTIKEQPSISCPFIKILFITINPVDEVLFFFQPSNIVYGYPLKQY